MRHARSKQKACICDTINRSILTGFYCSYSNFLLIQKKVYKKMLLPFSPSSILLQQISIFFYILLFYYLIHQRVKNFLKCHGWRCGHVNTHRKGGGSHRGAQSRRHGGGLGEKSFSHVKEGSWILGLIWIYLCPITRKM